MQKILFVLISQFVLLTGGIALCEVPVNKGRVTGLDIPRFVSLKSNKTFVRRGPGKSYRIDWVLEKSGLPLKVIGEYKHWRQVEDFEGDRGWVYFRLLSGKRTIITTRNGIFLRKKLGKDTKPVAILGFGIIGQLIKVDQNSCQAIFQKYKGWVDKENVWGC
jgi:SH3-like domain-containing protein